MSGLAQRLRIFATQWQRNSHNGRYVHGLHWMEDDENGQRVERSVELTVDDLLAASVAIEPILLTDARDIDELPDRSVVIDSGGDVWQRFSDGWMMLGGHDEGHSSATVSKYGPMRLIHVGDTA